MRRGRKKCSPCLSQLLRRVGVGVGMVIDAACRYPPGVVGIALGEQAERFLVLAMHVAAFPPLAGEHGGQIRQQRLVITSEHLGQQPWGKGQLIALAEAARAA